MMQLDRRRSARRRGVAGLIAAVIMFTLLFTVGLGFYMNMTESNAQLQQAQDAKVANEQAAISENLYVTAIVNSSTNELEFAVTNQGGVTVSIVAFFATGYDPATPLTLPINDTGPGATYLPIVLSPTQSCPTNYSSLNPTPCLNMEVPCEGTTQQCSITLVTSRGNDFVATYYLTTGQSGVGTGGSSTQASVSEGMGSFSFDFSSFEAYYCPGGETSCTPSAPCSFQQPLCNGYDVPYQLTDNPSSTAFSFTLQNLDPCHRTIQLNGSNTVMTETDTGYTSYFGGQYIASASWNLATKSGGQLVTTSQPLTLAYNQKMTIYFAFPNVGCYSFWFGCQNHFASDPYSVSLTLVGYTLAGTGFGSAGCPTGSYGQVFPLFTTVWEQRT